MLIHVSDSSELGFLSVITSAAAPFKIVKLGRNRKTEKRRNMTTASGFYLLRLVLFLQLWSVFYSSKQVKFTEETRSMSRLLIHVVNCNSLVFLIINRYKKMEYCPKNPIIN